VFFVEVVLGAIVVLVLALLLASLGGGLPPVRPDTDDPALPADRLLTSADFATMRFRTAVYGYRMEDVDAAMAALHAALLAHEQPAAAGRDAAEAAE